ncbi:carnitine O-acetyltransferase-like [Lampetra planeri]
MASPRRPPLLFTTLSSSSSEPGVKSVLGGEDGGHSLPRLPVPPLRQTLERYLKALEPLVPPEELVYTHRVVENFGKPGGLGEVLQARLERKAQRSDNWLREWWMKTTFLENRGSLAVHSNPGVVLPRQDFHDTQGQLRFAAKLISAVLKFKALVDGETLQGNLHRGRPLCMDQYRRIFSSCRVPGPRHDTVVNYALQRGGGNNPRHITVAHNYQFFQLDVYDSHGAVLSTEQLYWQLEKIWNLSIKTTKEPIGILTAEHRNRWGTGHDILIRDKLNRESTRVIQQSIFAVCLDAPMPPTTGEEDMQLSRMSAEILHGGGSRANSGNRWFDKTLQFVVGEDGTCGLLYERGVAEGVPIMRIADYAVADCQQQQWEEPRSSAASLETPRKLYFNINSDVKDLIESAKVHLDIQVGDLDIRCLVYRRFGKDFLKQQGLSPDAFIQMALQLAYYRLHGGVCSTSESATTRMFHLGRTDIVRSTSSHSLRFVEAFDSPDTPDAEKLALLRAAIQTHVEATEQAMTGQAIDAHLLGLKLQAIADGHSVPQLYMDTSYAIATHFRLFTKQVPAHMEAVMCQGPAVPDGYGVCYNPQASRISISVTALHCCRHTHASALALAVEAAFGDMHDVLLAPSPRAGDGDGGGGGEAGALPRRAPWEATQW